MGRTPDKTPGESYEEGTVYENHAAGDVPAELGGVRFVDGAFQFRDAAGVYDPRRPLTAVPNENVLELDPNAVGVTYSITRAGRWITEELWAQTSNGFPIKRITYAYTNKRVTTETRILYALADGITIVASKVLTYSYDGGALITGWTAGPALNAALTDEPLLETEPNMVGVTYEVTRTGRRVDQESWKQTLNGFPIRTIDYVFAAGQLSSEVRKVID